MMKLCSVFHRVIRGSTWRFIHRERSLGTCYSWFVPIARPKTRWWVRQRLTLSEGFDWSHNAKRDFWPCWRVMQSGIGMSTEAETPSIGSILQYFNLVEFHRKWPYHFRGHAIWKSTKAWYPVPAKFVISSMFVVSTCAEETQSERVCGL